MADQSILKSLGKWIAGIASVVIATLIIFFLTGESGCLINGDKAMDIEGRWLTPFNNLSYRITQNEYDYRWTIDPSFQSGTGNVEGKSLRTQLDGEDVIYDAMVWDSHGNPVVLFTTHPKYFGIILFRSCEDFVKFIHDYSDDLPQLKDYILGAARSIPNPTCPNAFD